MIKDAETVPGVTAPLPVVNYRSVHSRFAILTPLVMIMRVAGFLAVLVGLIGVGYGIFEPMQPGHEFGNSDTVAIASGSLLILFGLAIVIFAAVVGVLFAIEANTRRLAEAMEEGAVTDQIIIIAIAGEGATSRR